MPKVLPEYTEIVKSKIIQAAIKVFSKKGYHNSTMDEIAKEVKMSKVTIYSYFNSKEEIVQAGASQTLTKPFQKMFINNHNTLEPLEEIYNMMIESQGILHLNFELAALSSQNENLKKIYRNAYEEQSEVLQNFIQNQQNKGYIRTDINSKTLTQLLIALYHDIALQLVIGCEKSKVHKTWSKSLSTLLEKQN